MYTNDFEEKFDDFLDAREFEDAENALFQLIRAAFAAGWIAAGGDPPVICPMFPESELEGFAGRKLLHPEGRRSQ